MLSGTLPASAEDRAIDQINGGPGLPPLKSINPGVSSRTDAVIEKAMSMRVADRYQSCTEMADALPTYRANASFCSSIKRRIPDSATSN